MNVDKKKDAVEPSRYLRRLERLVTSLLRRRFEGARDLWRLQLDLLQLQRDVQTDITQEKARVRQEGADPERLAMLRQVFWHARRFGDAIAWVFLRADRRLLFALALNQRAPVPPHDHGARGLVAAAEALSNQGFGFPLLHDITDLLRIGDLSLITFDSAPRLVEVKTSLIGEWPEDGAERVSYQISAVWPESLPHDEQVKMRKLSGSTPANGVPSPRPRKRLDRQMRRMKKAHLWGSVEPGLPQEFEGERIIAARGQATDRPSRWPLIRKLIREARRTSYSSAAVDDAFLYVALYDAEGLDKDSVADAMDSLPEDLVHSGIFFEDRTRNSLMINFIPHAESGAPQLFLPYYLYPLPRRAILDILHGRLLLMNLMNPGRVVEVLESQGFSVRLAEDQEGFRSDPFLVTTEFSDDQGNSYRGQMQNLRMHLDEMVMEFLPLSYLVDVARTMHQAMQQAALEAAGA